MKKSELDSQRVALQCADECLAACAGCVLTCCGFVRDLMEAQALMHSYVPVYPHVGSFLVLRAKLSVQVSPCNMETSRQDAAADTLVPYYSISQTVIF